ncbi:MAG TPA: hypothetical protein VMU79_04750 [Casimicrobiaceae bacterium]|nr:hypothetical protein [Casimicrobiaceae bacterium]
MATLVVAEAVTVTDGGEGGICASAMLIVSAAQAPRMIAEKTL